ncbi:sensor domain-containing diguanylate cyclase [Limisalsivibrio acetivorans]|uniref:sensor domain-containing diguanylate cyclase n=1 Tax=Limisalsivibrio acetivorans TaxID=1304888 RepID=UPI0003B4B54F|nr:sensor domain-containing diguanylate cyclase [Limisalsivibrio acetivorans]
MGRLENIIKENRELKDEINSLIERVRENEAKHSGFRVIEYSFLLSNSIADLIEKPIAYLEEIFDIESAVLFLNSDILDFDRETDNYTNKVVFYPEKVFKYFFLETRPYYGKDVMNVISEFNFYEQMGSYLIAPIVDEGRIIGSLNLYSSDKTRFGDGASVDFLRELSFVVMVALKKMYSTEVIYRQARTDFLTGCQNKMAMAELIKRLLNQYERYGNGFHFIMLDIDNFKTINDSEGHLTGDRVIRDLADGLRDNLRASDIVGRFGGDEFYIIVPDTENINLNMVVKKIEGVATEVFEKHGYHGRVGISGGSASVPGDAEKTSDAENLVRIADTRLYDSKRSGKGRFKLKDDN